MSRAGCWDRCVQWGDLLGPRTEHPQPKANGHLNSTKKALTMKKEVIKGIINEEKRKYQGGRISDARNGVGPKGRKLNGNGVAHRPDDKQSTLSRLWTVERPRGNGSTYQAVRRACRERGCLYEDNEFPPLPRSLYRHKKPHLHPIIWMRPHEMCQRPRFYSEGSRSDIESGELGDSWFIGAVSSLTLTPRFLDRIVPPDQSFDTTSNYCGLFRFRFWHFGEWKEVLIDDRLPTFKGRLVYSHSTNPTEFWVALLEKAYAKLYGCYENLSSGGSTTRALQDLTGGIVQSFGLTNQDRYLTYQVLNSAVPRSSLLIASINPEKENKRQLRLRNGLMTQTAYSVTGLARVRGHAGETPLVRLRNPWGKGEWTGPWSERSWEWDALSERDKELLSVRVRNDGEFWMSFEDFARHFTHLDLVHIGPDDWMVEPALQTKQPWRAVLARRRWRSGHNAGGGPNFTETTAMNPQFHIMIPRTTSNKCHVVVSVTQYYETQPEAKKKKHLYAIGFAVYEIPPSMSRLTPQFVVEQKPLDVTNHSVAREVVTFFTLPPGDYIIVPQTNIPNCDGKFLLRILTDEQSNIWEVNEDNMVFRNISAEFLEDALVLPDGKSLVTKLLLKYPPEVDVNQLHKILKSHWKAYLLEKPSIELCKSLIMLRDVNISGRINLLDIPILMHMLQFWRIAFEKFDKGNHASKTSSYNLRALLWEAGSTVSNKVLECLVLRFAKNTILSAECFVMAMVRLHLAHERYHSLDTKMKGNPISLEEMILMTIYS
ncbi:calpain-9-like isoform X2 [Cimex lectularius]|uniref:Calpain catalytic domain-containing protein n=1 Tax=Cimex lectularius TaxID=79782 RepID=A0A8I6TDP9_CIMLE|nr:calpain-9-like isoform X2 [Cimex lectularius]